MGRGGSDAESHREATEAQGAGQGEEHQTLPSTPVGGFRIGRILLQATHPLPNLRNEGADPEARNNLRHGVPQHRQP